MSRCKFAIGLHSDMDSAQNCTCPDLKQQTVPECMCRTISVPPSHRMSSSKQTEVSQWGNLDRAQNSICANLMPPTASANMCCSISGLPSHCVSRQKFHRSVTFEMDIA